MKDIAEETIPKTSAVPKRLAAKSALDLPRAKVGVPFNQPIYIFYLAILLERCGHEQASFCQPSPGRLAVLLQAVQEG